MQQKNASIGEEKTYEKKTKKKHSARATEKKRATRPSMFGMFLLFLFFFIFVFIEWMMIEAVQLGGCVRQQVCFFLFALKKKRNNEIRRIVCATRTENRTGIEIEGGGGCNAFAKKWRHTMVQACLFSICRFFVWCVCCCVCVAHSGRQKQTTATKKKKKTK